MGFVAKERPVVNPNEIRNKQKRTAMKAKLKMDKEAEKSKAKAKRKRDAEDLGANAPPKQKQKTQDNMREADETVVTANDDEVQGDEAIDEFASHFGREKEPKILITTGYTPSKQIYDFIRDLLCVFPNSFYYKRSKIELKKIVVSAKKRDFTDLVIINEDRKKINGLTLVHLPDGPTMHFKLSTLTMSKDIKGAGAVTSHKPEVILNNFNTRLGRRVGRMLGSMFHQEPNFTGRRVATFHNQRDFIFFRHHRYIFAPGKKARLQELGPRFTLKLRWVQAGTFDTKHGEYEWLYQNNMGKSRRKFFL